MPKEFPKNNINRKIIYLILWIIFFIGISIFIMSGRKNEQSNNINNTNTNVVDDDFEIPDSNINIYRKSKEKILKKNYQFKYIYDGPTGKVIYTGTSFDNKISLIREDIYGIEKLYIENDLLYKYTLDEKYITDYEINHNTYLDIDYIFENINEESLSYIENENILEIQFSINNCYGKLYISDENINKIEIYEDVQTYTLEYSNIGKITEVN